MATPSEQLDAAVRRIVAAQASQQANARQVSAEIAAQREHGQTAQSSQAAT